MHHALPVSFSPLLDKGTVRMTSPGRSPLLPDGETMKGRTMKKYFLTDAVDLHLFDGGASGASGETGGGDGAAVGGTNGSPDSTQQGKTGGTKVVYGKQDNAPAAEDGTTGTEDAAPENQHIPFKDLIAGDYKADFDAEVNRIIGRRMRNVKDQSDTIAAQQPILDALAQRYGVQPGDLAALQNAVNSDNSMWEQAAEEAGMSVEQYRQYQQLQRENQQLREAQQNFFQRQRQQQQVQTWLAQAEEMKQDPLLADFDLQAEIDGNPDFLDLLKRGVSVEQAYKVLHMDDFLTKATAQAEKAVTGNIRARGARPAENGAASKSSAIVKDDVHSLSRKDRAEIARRAAMGETITF